MALARRPLRDNRGAEQALPIKEDWHGMRRCVGRLRDLVASLSFGCIAHRASTRQGRIGRSVQVGSGVVESPRYEHCYDERWNTHQGPIAPLHRSGIGLGVFYKNNSTHFIDRVGLQAIGDLIRVHVPVSIVSFDNDEGPQKDYGQADLLVPKLFEFRGRITRQARAFDQ
jgi:hypothetical protein